ncbi:Dna2/Cas4 domain-containing protein [Poseidonocella sp. HB161398]|uniref:CRISPR-associated protein Cas4 n=1 Tax=Rhodobacterales TaxID=204455 RepID=UPI001486E103|nr:Dna2/Cas4 domain-containing protein [Poseidonocella sp. HB161398]
MTDPGDPRIAVFADLCELHGLHGLAFQHIRICRRRAWLHLHRVDYAHLEDRMAQGLVAHANSKARDRSINGLIGLAPDRIDWENRIVVEAKGRAGAADAVSMQAAFYALLLTARTGNSWAAAVDILAERRMRMVEITDGMVDALLSGARQLAGLISVPCPSGIDAPICGTCSYREFCGKI